jgi:hypothetical protein
MRLAAHGFSQMPKCYTQLRAAMLSQGFGNNLVLGSREHDSLRTRRTFKHSHPADGERCRWRDILAWGRPITDRSRHGR